MFVDILENRGGTDMSLTVDLTYFSPARDLKQGLRSRGRHPALWTVNGLARDVIAVHVLHDKTLTREGGLGKIFFRY